MTDPFEGIEDIPWSKLRQCYGPATDAPMRLRELVSSDWEVRSEALYGFLWTDLYHQYALYPATPYAIGFIIGALTHESAGQMQAPPNRPFARYLLEFLHACGELGQGGIEGTPFSNEVTIEGELAKGLEAFRKFVDDPDAETAEHARWLVSFCGKQLGLPDQVTHPDTAMGSEG